MTARVMPAPKPATTVPVGGTQLTNLEAIQIASPPAPPETVADILGDIDRAKTRLTTGVTLMTLMQLGAQINLITVAYGNLPNADPNSLEGYLKDIMKACKDASDKASRLLAGNR
jgi:hypothetical protein